MKNAVKSIILFWIFLTLAFVIPNEVILRSGAEVWLKTSLYDPVDILRGNYVNLSFDVTNVSTKDNEKFTAGQRVYLPLKKGAKNLASAKDYLHKEKTDDPLFLEGVVLHCGISSKEKKTTCNVRYGIENYFTSAKKARKIEKDLQTGGFARVKIKNGKAKIIEIKSEIPQ